LGLGLRARPRVGVGERDGDRAEDGRAGQACHAREGLGFWAARAPAGPGR